MIIVRNPGADPSGGEARTGTRASLPAHGPDGAQADIPRIDVERATREQLIAHIDELEWLLGATAPRFRDTRALRDICRLTTQEALATSALASGRLCTRDHLENVITKWKNEILSNGVSVTIHRARKKLARFGIEIRNVYGEGYIVDKPSLSRLRALIAGEG